MAKERALLTAGRDKTQRLLLQESPAIYQPLFTKCTPQRQGHSNVQLLIHMRLNAYRGGRFIVLIRSGWVALSLASGAAGVLQEDLHQGRHQVLKTGKLITWRPKPKPSQTQNPKESAESERRFQAPGLPVELPRKSSCYHFLSLC